MKIDVKQMPTAMLRAKLSTAKITSEQRSEIIKTLERRGEDVSVFKKVNMLREEADKAYQRLAEKKNPEINKTLAEIWPSGKDFDELTDSQFEAIIAFEKNPIAPPKVAWSTKEEDATSKKLQIEPELTKDGSKNFQPSITEDFPFEEAVVEGDDDDEINDDAIEDDEDAVEQHAILPDESETEKKLGKVFESKLEKTVIIGGRIDKKQKAVNSEKPKAVSPEKPKEQKERAIRPLATAPRPGTRAEKALALLKGGATIAEVANQLEVTRGFLHKLWKRFGT